MYRVQFQLASLSICQILEFFVELLSAIAFATVIATSGPSDMPEHILFVDDFLPHSCVSNFHWHFPLKFAFCSTARFALQADFRK